MAESDPPRTVEGESFLEGKLLIALPGMTDPRFDRSVIFMCAHSLEPAPWDCSSTSRSTA